MKKLKILFRRLKGLNCKGYLGIILLFAPLFSIAQNKNIDLFTQGNNYYAKADYKQAVAVYKQLLKADVQSSALYFNLGNAYYKLDELPSAILNYEKAYKLSPNDDDIRVNIQLANQKIADKIEAVPQLFVTQWWRNFMLSFSLNTWSVLGVVFFVLGFLALITYLFAQILGVKKSAFYAGLSLLILALVCLVTGTAQHHYFNKHQEAILFSGAVNAKSAPNDSQKTVFVIHEGTKVKISKKEGEWVKIELPNGNVGWIAYSAVRVI